MSKASPGLRKRGKVWHIDKIIAGRRIQASTGETELEAAERYLKKLAHDIREVEVYGESPVKTFDQAAARYILEAHKKSLDRDLYSLDAVMPYIGSLPLLDVHAFTLEEFVHDRQEAGIAAGTIKRDLAVIRQVLKFACQKWREANGKPWLQSVPMLPSVHGPKRKPRPISRTEQASLFQLLPDYLAEMALFAINTGCRDQEICTLRWDWEHTMTDTDISVFILPENHTKNGHERIVPLNAIARSIIEHRRSLKEPGDEWVFGKKKPLDRMNNTAWRKAREQADLQDVRVHDLRHSFGQRLRYAGVSLEDRQDLLGHHAGRITTHYSKAEIGRLIEAVETLCDSRLRPEITLVRKKS